MPKRKKKSAKSVTPKPGFEVPRERVGDYRIGRTRPRFAFRSGNKRFSCTLKCIRCQAAKSGGGRCTRAVCIGLPVCFQHAVSVYHVKVLPAGRFGKGVFAWDRRQRNNQKVFVGGQKIVPYFGETITTAERNRRYGNSTAIYGYDSKGKGYQDGACQRGLGTLINDYRGIGTANAEFSGGWIKASKPIYHGQQILLNYGDNYWRAHQASNPSYYTRRQKVDENKYS